MRKFGFMDGWVDGWMDVFYLFTLNYAYSTIPPRPFNAIRIGLKFCTLVIQTLESNRGTFYQINQFPWARNYL